MRGLLVAFALVAGAADPALRAGSTELREVEPPAVVVTVTRRSCRLSTRAVREGTVRFRVVNRTAGRASFVFDSYPKRTIRVPARRTRVVTWQIDGGRTAFRCLLGSRVVAHGSLLVRFVPEPTFGVSVTGPEETVFDWTTDRCDDEDIPDIMAHAFRDAGGTVHLYASHYTTRRMSGPDLNGVRRDCSIIFDSHRDPRPELHADREWLSGLYAADGTTVYALVHNEYQGHHVPGMCASGLYFSCLYQTVTLYVSRDAGRTFAPVRSPPDHLVAALPFPYIPDSGPIGMMDGSGIIRHPRDGYYYVFVRQIVTNLHDPIWRGQCLLRTEDLTDPRSWRAWDGVGFNHRFIDPYRERAPRENYLCAPLVMGHDLMGQSLTYNTYLERFVAVGTGSDATSGGFYFSTSENLVDWTEPQLILPGEMTYTYACGDPDPMAYVSLLDPESPSRNFETTGKRAFIYFTRMHYRNCRMTLDRDLVRVPVAFSRSDR